MVLLPRISENRQKVAFVSDTKYFMTVGRFLPFFPDYSPSTPLLWLRFGLGSCFPDVYVYL